MRRPYVYCTLAASGLMALGLAWLANGSQADPNNGDNGQKAKAVEVLPIRQAVLFNSGVGYYQREGVVDGTTQVPLTFSANDINDLLKSLVLQDLGGGRISTVSYDSFDPIEKILRSFALDLNNNPTFGQILNQARGEKIEVALKDAKGQAIKLQGNIVGMEVQKRFAGKEGVAIDEEQVNLSTAAGLQSIPLSQVFSVRFLNPVLESEFQRALQVLAGAHDRQKKTVSLGFAGNGKRAVRVGYVVDRPIWKTSYRLRLDPGGRVVLQGWAIVENTSDDDWNDIRMVLVSGKPISFKMNLYEPLYIPRPEVEPELFASLRPPVYSGSMNPGDQVAANPVPMPPAAGPATGAGAMPGQGQGMPPMQWGAMPNGGFFNPYFGQMGGFGGGQMGGFNYANGQFGNVGNNSNFDPRNNTQNLNNRFQNNELQIQQQLLNEKGNKLTYEELQRRRQEQDRVKEDAKAKGSAVAALNFKEGIQSVASAEEVGDYYQYVLDQRISLARQKSAMLPIIDQTIEGTKVSIFNEGIHGKYPLLGLKLKNTSGQPLTQGPITVYDESTYAGDTRILDLQPGEERYLSYALDQATEVKTDVKETPSPEMNFKIGTDQLSARFKLRQTRTYTIKNRSTHERTLVVEHPIRTNWTLLPGQKPAETTRNVHRFIVQAPTDKVVTFDVVEEQARLDTFALSSPNGTPLYAIGLGVEVKPVVQASDPKLTDLKIQKGFLLPTYKVRESKTYYVQNLSDQDRQFTVDHVIRPDWTRIEPQADPQRGPGVYRFKLEVKKGKTGTQEVTEERTYQEKAKILKEIGDTRLREFLNSPIPSPEVRAALTKVLALSTRVQDSQEKKAELEKELDILTKDQARLRANLEVIPQSAEPYKKFLDKFVTQESQIEALQREHRQVQALLQTQTRDYTEFAAKLDAE